MMRAKQSHGGAQFATLVETAITDNSLKNCQNQKRDSERFPFFHLIGLELSCPQAVTLSLWCRSTSHQSFKLLRGKLEDWMPTKEAEEALQSNKQAAWETNYKA